MARQTTLDLNGPILSFTTNPTDATVCSGIAVTFVGIATATFLTGISTDSPNAPDNNATNTGTIAYRWYDDEGPLFDDPPGGSLSLQTGQTINGAGTSTLTLYNPTKTTNIYVTADYVPSAYGLSGVAVTVGSARSTGNGLNDFLPSSSALLTVYPNIEITSEPLDKTVSQGTSASFTATSKLTDGSTDGLVYKWKLNDNYVDDGTYNADGFTTSGQNGTLKITDDSDGSVKTVNFSELASYSSFTAGKTYTLVSNGDITGSITGYGAGGGRSDVRNVAGALGGKTTGKFTFVSGQTYKLVVGTTGKNGNVGGAGGFGGGGAGGGGWGRGGGGGGYVGLFINSVTLNNAILIAAGGGGGSNDPANGGRGGGFIGEGGVGGQGANRNGGGATQSAGGNGGLGPAGTRVGLSGSALQGGAGGSGGGGGYYGGGGGQHADGGCCADGAGGGGSAFVHPTLITDGTTESGKGSPSNTDGQFVIEGISSTLPATITISGTKTDTVTVSTNAKLLAKLQCEISHPIACNSPVLSRIANFTTVDARSIINFESISSVNKNSTSQLWDLNEDGDYEIVYDTVNNSNTYVSFYSTEKDISINVQMYGKRGSNKGSYLGGEGGFSSIKFTLEKNVEYVITGLFDAIGAPAIYKKASLIAVVGAGGDAGSGGRGGNGSGVGISGETGRGKDSGNGGDVFSAGTLPENGYWFGAYTGTILSPETINQEPLGGGRIIPCTRGVYWRNLGFSACSDVGTSKFILGDGTVLSDTASITRGFKEGLIMNNNKGIRSGNGGNGGAGQNGGAGGYFGGGGGGSGYTDGSVQVISTTQGGGTGVARVIISAA